MMEVKHIGLLGRLKIKLADWQTRDDKWKLYVGGGTAALLIVVAIIWVGTSTVRKKITTGNSSLNPVPTLSVNKIAEPKTETAPLDGVKLTKSEYQTLSKRRPLAIMVENHQDARPQSGLDQAELVWEAVVEGGITRFMPVYWRNLPEVVGPIRSARKYYLDWTSELGDALYMHIGGATSTNPQANALAYIQQHGMKSLGINGRGTFWRVSSRFAPHNAYSDTDHLWSEAQRIGWGEKQPLGLWKFKNDVKQDNLGATTEIALNWNGWGQTSWSVRWVFDAEKNEYQRFHNVDQPHTDAVTNEQLTAKNIAVAFMNVAPANDGTARVVYETIGNGRALVFRDGAAIEGSWSKSSRTDRTRFYDSAGEEIKFNRGKTWIMAVPVNSEISY